MGKKVEVDYQVLEDAIQEMNDAKDEFHSCVENGFKTELEKLVNEELLEVNGDYIKLTNKQNIKEMDEKLAEKGETNGGTK